MRGDIVPEPETIASAIRIGNPASWNSAIRARDESGGAIDMVSDEKILDAYRLMASGEGVFCEPGVGCGCCGSAQALRGGAGP